LKKQTVTRSINFSFLFELFLLVGATPPESGLLRPAVKGKICLAPLRAQRRLSPLSVNRILWRDCDEGTDPSGRGNIDQRFSMRETTNMLFFLESEAERNTSTRAKKTIKKATLKSEGTY